MNPFSKKVAVQAEPAPGTEPASEAPAVQVAEGTTSEETEEVEQEIPNPFFEGSQVEEVLQPDVHGQWHRCRMADGTTKDVPINLFRVVKRIPTSPSA